MSRRILLSSKSSSEFSVIKNGILNPNSGIELQISSGANFSSGDIFSGTSPKVLFNGINVAAVSYRRNKYAACNGISYATGDRTCWMEVYYYIPQEFYDKYKYVDIHPRIIAGNRNRDITPKTVYFSINVGGFTTTRVEGYAPTTLIFDKLVSNLELVNSRGNKLDKITIRFGNGEYGAANRNHSPIADYFSIKKFTFHN